MNYTKVLKKTLLLLSILVLASSCARIAYSPKVSLDISPETIKKTVQVEKFEDNSPDDDKEDPFLGASMTNDNAMSNKLDVEITNAIISDFSTNALFSNVSRRIDNPDYILKGEILKFKGHTGFNMFAKITLFVPFAPILWYFGIPVTLNESDIEISISIYDNNDNLISTYSVIASDETYESMYVNQFMAMPGQTNKTFSKAVGQLREKILADIGKFK